MTERETASVQGEPIRCQTRCDQWPNCQHDWSAWEARPTVPAPSDEAVKAAAERVTDLFAADGHYDRAHSRAAYIVKAAYAVDLPRLLAEAQAARTAEIEWLRDALDFITGGSDRGPWVFVYREAGGGYEGLQAIARTALAAHFNPEAE